MSTIKILTPLSCIIFILLLFLFLLYFKIETSQGSDQTDNIMKVLLFDIDGTLVHTGGAGLRALQTAFEKVYGLPNAMEKISLGGRTDTSIVKEVLGNEGVTFNEEKLLQFKKVYSSVLKQEINIPGYTKKIMPGIQELLDSLSQRENVYLGILTGNWKIGGLTKLAYFDLEAYFSFGAFSDDAELRNDLLPFAADRFQRKYNLDPAPHEYFIIGDTPADIRCARPHGATAVAVAAARYTADQLEAHNPDFLFENFKDLDRAVRILG